MYASSTIILLAFTSSALGIAFIGPASTLASVENLHGFSPSPTVRPPSLPELFRRQQRDEGLCGYAGGLSGMYIGTIHYTISSHPRQRLLCHARLVHVYTMTRSRGLGAALAPCAWIANCSPPVWARHLSAPVSLPRRAQTTASRWPALNPRRVCA